VYVPGALHVFEALVTPAASQAETLPSDHENRYWTESPVLETEPLAEYVYATPVTPVAGPEGRRGADTVSAAAAGVVTVTSFE